MPIIVISPLLGLSWIMISPLIVAAAGALGYKTLTGRQLNDWLQKELVNEIKNFHKIRLPLDEMMTEVVSEELGREERLDFRKDDIVVTFRKDALNKFRIEVTGPRTIPRMQMMAMGDEFARKVIQQFSHNKIARELDQRGINIVEEEVDENGNIVLKTRKWS